MDTLIELVEDKWIQISLSPGTDSIKGFTFYFHYTNAAYFPNKYLLILSNSNVFVGLRIESVSSN